MAIILHSTTAAAPAVAAAEDGTPVGPEADVASPPDATPVPMATPPLDADADGDADGDGDSNGVRIDDPIVSKPEATTTTAATTTTTTTTTTTAPVYPQPKLRLEVRDVAHPGADVFFSAANASAVFSAAVVNVQRLLYGQPTKKSKARDGNAGGGGWSPDRGTHVPSTRSVTVILRDMPGVAYTTGSELDDEHKEIHVSLGYLANSISPPTPARRAAEVAGVLTHELVHCYQWNAHGSCPGGLIEGIADWVRLHCGLAPPHWKREPAAGGIRWDSGYQHTAYFLDYLERRFGPGTVRRINERLRKHRYDADAFWPGLLGHAVDALWDDYVDAVKNELPEALGAAAVPAKRRVRRGKRGKKGKGGAAAQSDTAAASASSETPISPEAGEPGLEASLS